MKILKLDHIGIAANSIDQAAPFWSAILGLEIAGVETVEQQKTNTAFLPVGESEIEILESTTSDGPVAKYIRGQGEGVHHIALRVENIEEALQELQDKGVRLIDAQPRLGAGGAKIAFIHPQSTKGVLLELCER
jgi:methylmalonyl-CoA/ethylmalonyl-CoA epimerase